MSFYTEVKGIDVLIHDTNLHASGMRACIANVIHAADRLPESEQRNDILRNIRRIEANSKAYQMVIDKYYTTAKEQYEANKYQGEQ
jgi:hypothetical protein